MVRDCRPAAGEDGQRDQERVAHPPQEAARPQRAGAAPGGQEAQEAGGGGAEARGQGQDEEARRADRQGGARAVLARALRLVHAHRVDVHGLGGGGAARQLGQLRLRLGVRQGGVLHLVRGVGGVPDRRELLVGDAVHAAGRHQRRLHGAPRRVRQAGGRRRRRHGLLAQGVHGGRRRRRRQQRRRARLTAGLGRGESSSFVAAPELIVLFSLSLPAPPCCIGGIANREISSQQERGS
ncbi:hypothetical protein VPH35_038749 [Triticum aestivum]